MKNVDPNLLSKTKKVRRVQIANVPIYLGLSKNEIKKLVTDFIVKHFLNDQGNMEPIHTLDIVGNKELNADDNPNANMVVLEMSSVEEANRLQKVPGVEILGMVCKIIRCSEAVYSQEQSMVTQVNRARVS